MKGGVVEVRTRWLLWQADLGRSEFEMFKFAIASPTGCPDLCFISFRCLDSLASVWDKWTLFLETGSTMVERHPASLRSVKNARSLRRRSGTASKDAHEGTPELDPARHPSRSSTRASSSSLVSGKSRRMSTVVEHLSSDPRPNTSRRVSTIKDSPLPPLPGPSPNLAGALDPDNPSHCEGNHDGYPQPFSDVALTPARRSPDLERDGSFSRFSSYLPTPNFSRQSTVRSRMLIPRNSMYPESSRRSEAETLVYNRPRPTLASSSNWTQKWPKPRANARSLGGLVAAIEESEGLGFDKPDRWTTHKWVLLMSILMSFGYSCVGLIYAMLTWFRGEGNDNFYLCYFLICGRLEICRGHVHGGQRHPDLHHLGGVYSNFRVLGWALWGDPELTSHLGRLLSSALACLDFSGDRGVHQLQTNGIRAGQEN